jgi:hypothetical protein
VESLQEVRDRIHWRRDQGIDSEERFQNSAIRANVTLRARDSETLLWSKDPVSFERALPDVCDELKIDMNPEEFKVMSALRTVQAIVDSGASAVISPNISQFKEGTFTTSAWFCGGGKAENSGEGNWKSSVSGY